MRKNYARQLEISKSAIAKAAQAIGISFFLLAPAGAAASEVNLLGFKEAFDHMNFAVGPNPKRGSALKRSPRQPSI